MNCSSFSFKIMHYEQDYFVKQDFDVSSLDYEKAKLCITGYENFAEALNKCFFIFDYYKHNFFFIKSYNEYLKKIPTTIKEPYLFFNNNIHPEDLDFVYQINNRTFNYIFSLPYEQKQGLKLFFNCRFLNCYEQFEMTNITLKLIETDSKGNIWLVLFIIEKSDSENYAIPFVETKNREIRQFTLNQMLLKKLTDTEKEIVLYLFGNMTHKEISDLLRKSIKTVRFHIYNIKNKLEVKNMLDLQKKLLSK